MLRQDGECIYSVEVQGPILPHSIVSLMKLLQASDYTAILTALPSSKPFSAFHNPTAATSASSAFGKESLSDCGLDRTSLDLFCSSQPAPSVSGGTTSEMRFQNGSFYYDV